MILNKIIYILNKRFLKFKKIIYLDFCIETNKINKFLLNNKLLKLSMKRKYQLDTENTQGENVKAKVYLSLQ